MNQSRRLVVVIALLWGTLGIFSLMRFAAPEFRPWERLYDAEARRFLAEHKIEMREIGDLGYKTWNRDLQKPRETRFSTDRWGYRNPTEITAPEVLVIGDSYVAGSGLSDDETVSVRLAEHLGVPVYNFAGQALNAPAFFMREARFVEHRPKVVIWAPVARGIAARPLLYRDSEPPAPSLRESIAELGQSISSWIERINRDNGLVREARFAVQGWIGEWTENPRLRRLPNGEEVLALSLLEQNLLATPEQRNVDHCIEMVAAFAQILERVGVRFVFSPIPESGSIYPELFDASERGALPRDDFLDRLITGVEARGVEVVDLKSVYQRSSEPYLYLPDDSHWNARAADLAAAAWAETLAGSFSTAQAEGR